MSTGEVIDFTDEAPTTTQVKNKQAPANTAKAEQIELAPPTF